MKDMILWSYNLHPSQLLGGPGWVDTDKYDVVAKPEAQYRAWLQRTKAAGMALDKTAYDALAHPSSAVPAMTYGSVSAGLFETVSGGSTMAAHMHLENQ